MILGRRGREIIVAESSESSRGALRRSLRPLFHAPQRHGDDEKPDQSDETARRAATAVRGMSILGGRREFVRSSIGSLSLITARGRSRRGRVLAVGSRSVSLLPPKSRESVLAACTHSDLLHCPRAERSSRARCVDQLLQNSAKRSHFDFSTLLALINLPVRLPARSCRRRRRR